MGDGSWLEARGVVAPLTATADVGSGDGALEDMCVEGRADGRTMDDIDTFLLRVCAAREQYGSGEGDKREGGKKAAAKTDKVKTLAAASKTDSRLPQQATTAGAPGRKSSNGSRRQERICIPMHDTHGHIHDD